MIGKNSIKLHYLKKKLLDNFAEEVNRTALSSKDNKKKMKSIDSMKTYSLGTSKYLLREKVESKCNNLIKQCRK